MAIVFAVNARDATSNYAARYSTSGGNGYSYGTVSRDSDAGAISGYNFNLASGGAAIRGIIWPGFQNTPATRTWSVLVRLKPNYSGTPGTAVGMIRIGSVPGGSSGLGSMAFHHNTSGNIVCLVNDESCNNLGSLTVKSAWSPTSGTWYDIVVTWDGTNGTGSLKGFVDAVAGATATPSGSWPVSKNQYLCTDINLGNSANVSGSNYYFDEVVIWDSVIDPTANQTLESGSAKLNGASRSSLVSVTAQSSGYTDPGVANVKTGTTYLFGGSTNTGTYDGSDRWTDPGESNVRNGTAYKANSTSNNKTGNVVVPSTANTKTGVSVDTAGTGTYDGSDRWTDPTEACVKTGTAYKANSTTNNKTGTYTGSDRWTDPGALFVLNGVEYKANSTTNNKTGTLGVTTENEIAAIKGLIAAGL